MVALSAKIFAGLIVRGLSARELLTFSHLSAHRVMPATVLVTGAVTAMSMRTGAAALVSPESTPTEVVLALLALMEVTSTDGGHLPLRLVAVGSKWIKRLRVDAACLPPIQFDEATADVIIARGSR